VSVREYFFELLASLQFFCEARIVTHIVWKFGTGAFRIVKLSVQVRSTHNQDGAVVLDILHGQMFRANFVGSRILELLKQGRTEQQIADELSSEFGVPRETIATDVREFLAHLEENHLLDLRHSEAPPFL
jgi:hypothetical protein